MEGVDFIPFFFSPSSFYLAGLISILIFLLSNCLWWVSIAWRIKAKFLRLTFNACHSFPTPAFLVASYFSAQTLQSDFLLSFEYALMFSACVFSFFSLFGQIFPSHPVLSSALVRFYVHWEVLLTTRYCLCPKFLWSLLPMPCIEFILPACITECLPCVRHCCGCWGYGTGKKFLPRDEEGTQ